MFDIAWSELLLIAIVALIFIGPKELPQVLHSLGKNLSKLRRSADDFRRQFEDSMREAGYEHLHKNPQDLRHLNPANQLKNSIDQALNQEYVPQRLSPPKSAPGVEGAAALPGTELAAAGTTQEQAASLADGAAAVTTDGISQEASQPGQENGATQKLT